MKPKYDSERIQKFYDNYGEKEWRRFEENIRSEVAFHIHKHYLYEFVKNKDKVLDVGAGPGRFTIELAKLGANICVSDISETQLKLNKEKIKEANLESSILWRKQMDIAKPLEILDDAFDVVLCYGGPLSYVFENVKNSLKELIRITKPGGYLLLSVMSKIGTTQLYLSSAFDLVKSVGLDLVDGLMKDGDLVDPLIEGDHCCHMFTWSELKALIDDLSCEIIETSASNFLSMYQDSLIRQVQDEESTWEKFFEWELTFCKEPGILDAGTHIIVVLKKTAY